MLTVIGGLTMYGTTAALGQFLTNHVLDTYAPTVPGH
jgi:flagellar protein FlaJ